MITRLQVRNFKSLKDIDLSLGPLNVLVGPNMSGKSNILDVLRFLREVFFPESGTQGVSYALTQRGGANEVLWKGGEEKLITIVLEIVDEAKPIAKYRYSLELIGGPGNFTAMQNESLKRLLPEREVELILREQGSVNLLNADGKVAGGIGQSGVSVMQYASPGWDGYRFMQWVERWRSYHLVPPAMKEPSSMSLGEVLTPDGDNLSAYLMWLQTRSPESFGRINEVLHDLFPDVTQVKTIPGLDGKVHLGVTEKGLRRPTNVWQTSDGFLMLTALLSLIYAPPEHRTTLLCIEEPENYLHPRLLETVVALLRQTRQEVLDSKISPAQVMLTTQSPYLVNQFSLDEIIWTEKKNGETKAYRPADKRHLKTLIENKELGLGDLMFTGALGEEE
jgi:predicted ATPase